MGEFNSNFNFINGKLTTDQLLQVIRKNIAGELEAIHLYDECIRATDNKLAKKVLCSIRDEEKIHVGELSALLNELGNNEDVLFEKGLNEFKDLKKW